MPRTVESVREIVSDRPPALVHEGWSEAFPWLVQGTTTGGASSAPFDLGLFSGGRPESEVRERWGELARATGADVIVHARQVHGADVRVHGADEEPTTAGGNRTSHEPATSARVPSAVGDGTGEDAGSARLDLVEPCDGHATDRPGVVLAVTTADCVPVFVVDSRHRAVAMIHAGWRGAAAGILEEGLDAMRSSFGTRFEEVRLHLGPAICGACYEVGPEVFEALGRPAPRGPTPIDLRAVLAERAVERGVERTRVTISAHCTRCTASGLFSHRGGDAHRQVGYLGIRHDGGSGTRGRV